MTRRDHDYYARRAAQEDAAAAIAGCEAARDRHEELANAYRLRCTLGLGLDEDDGAPTLILSIADKAPPDCQQHNRGAETQSAYGNHPTGSVARE